MYRRNVIGVGSQGSIRIEPPRGQEHHDVYAPAANRLHFPEKEDVHWMCMFYPTWPRRIDGWKMPPNGDCRDLVTLNALQAMLNRACPTT